MIPLPAKTNESREIVRDEAACHAPGPSGEGGAAPHPWTAPDFVERSVCAEIGAYSMQDR